MFEIGIYIHENCSLDYSYRETYILYLKKKIKGDFIQLFYEVWAFRIHIYIIWITCLVSQIEFVRSKEFNSFNPIVTIFLEQMKHIFGQKWFEKGNITFMTGRLENQSQYKRGVQYVKSFEISFDLSQINHVTCCFRNIWKPL